MFYLIQYRPAGIHVTRNMLVQERSTSGFVSHLKLHTPAKHTEKANQTFK